MDTAKLGADLIDHIKAYIDQRLGIGLGGDGGGVVNELESTLSIYYDPFNTSTYPIALPLPQAHLKVLGVITQKPDHDHVVIWVATSSWDDFYKKLLTASRSYADFLDTAVNVQERFGFTSMQSTDLPSKITILAGDNYQALSAWANQYDQIYSAVLIRRYVAGTIPTGV